MTDKTPQETSAEFAAMMLGGTVNDGPVDPDSALGRLRAHVEKHGKGELTRENLRRAKKGEL